MLPYRGTAGEQAAGHFQLEALGVAPTHVGHRFLGLVRRHPGLAQGGFTEGQGRLRVSRTWKSTPSFTSASA